MIIDKLAYSSAIRHKSPFLKSGFAVGALLICVGSGTFLIAVSILLLMMAATLFISKTNAKHYKHLMVAPFVFLLLGTVVILLGVAHSQADIPKDTLFTVPIASIYLVVTSTRLIYATRLILISMSAVSCLYFLILTTPMTDLLLVLRKLHCPALVIEFMMMTYRYIFVLFEMAIALSTAQNCRLANTNARSAIRAFGGMLSTVLFRALQKANFLFYAMESRCYDGELHVLEEYTKASGKERLIVLGVLLLLVTIALVNSMYKIWI